MCSADLFCRNGENKVTRENPEYQANDSLERRAPSLAHGFTKDCWVPRPSRNRSELLGSGTARNTCSNEHHTYVFQKRRPTNKAFEKSENWKEKQDFPGGVRAYVSQRKGEADFARQPALRLWRPVGPLTSVPLVCTTMDTQSRRNHFFIFFIEKESKSNSKIG